MKPQLFLLHFAGGNAYSFQFMKQYLPAFDCITVELPGRGKRIQEPLLRDFDRAANDIFNTIIHQLIAPRFLLYGHSMGALLALKVVALLEQAGNFPLYTIVSGNAGPAARKYKNRYLMGKDEFIVELKKIGGMPDEVLQNEELFEFFRPIIQADFEIVEKYDTRLLQPVHSPLFAIMGNREEEVANIDNWRLFSHSSFQAEILDGDHFFIHKEVARVSQIIQDCYEQSYV